MARSLTSLKMTPLSTAVIRISVLRYSTLCVKVQFCATVLEAEIGSLNKTNALLRESLRVSEARMSDALKELESSRRERGFGERELERYRVKSALQQQTLQLPTAAAAADELTTPRSRAPSTGACSTTSTRRSLSVDRATLPPHARRSPTIAETDELLLVPSGGGRRADSSEHILRRKLEDALRTRDDLKCVNMLHAAVTMICITYEYV